MWDMSADGRNMKTLTQTTNTYCNIHIVNKDEMAVEVQIVLEEKSNTRALLLGRKVIQLNKTYIFTRNKSIRPYMAIMNFNAVSLQKCT